MECIILAGGFATRLWPLTEKTPKPLLPLAGQPLISHIIAKIPEDIKIHVSVNSTFADDFHLWRKKFANRSINIFVEDSNNEHEKLGALYSVAYCLQENKIDDDLLLIAGDNFLDLSVKKMQESFANKPLVAVYDIQNKEDASKFGVVVGQNGQVEQFMEKPQNPPSTLVSTGCSIIPRRLLGDFCAYAEQNRDNLGGVFEHFLAENEEVNYFSFNGKWFDIGSFPAFLEAHKYLVGGKLLEQEKVKKRDSQFKGAVFLGSRVEIRNSVIENSIVLDGAKVTNAEIRNSVIGRQTVISGVDLEMKIIRDQSFIVSN